MTVAEFLDRNGITPSLERGKWEPWIHTGFYELTSLNDLMVWPRVWCKETGLCWVETVKGETKLVRVENLRKYKSQLKDEIPQDDPKKQVRTEEKEKEFRRKEEERLRELREILGV